jgi:hypothetical protein
LLKYKEREGDCLVPQSYSEEGFPLGYWVSIQRNQTASLSGERRQRLDEIGFVWDARNG